MSLSRTAGFKSWLDAQTPGRRLWLMLLAIAGGLGVLGAVLPTPEPRAGLAPATAAVVDTTSGKAASPVAGKAADGTVVSADAAPVGEVRPGSSGRPVKTITIATKSSDAASKPAAPAATAEGAATPATASKPAAPPASDSSTLTAEPALKAVATKMNIQEVKSPGGISAWLVQEHSVPLLALRFVFQGGSSQDSDGKEGIANFITAMMDEGAGDLDATRFQEQAEELAFRMSFEDTRDSLFGTFETLSANRDPSLDMLRLAITKPRFDKDAVERIKKQLLVNLAYSAKNPERVASKSFAEVAFPGHVYGRPANGTEASIKSITSEDLEAYRQRVFARDNLKVVAVGDIDAKSLGEILDRVFGELPAKASLAPVAKTQPSTATKLNIVEMEVPQSVVIFGMEGLPRKDPDFMAAYVMNHVLGGGGFASRLTEQVREKRGLAYSVYSYLQPYRNASLFAGGVATKNESVEESIKVIRSELERMAREGPTEAELQAAKSYLTGSFALRFDTNAKIASQLLWMLNEDMGIDYADRRNALVDAVTLDDVKRAAQRVLKVDDLLVTVVGKPKGLNPG